MIWARALLGVGYPFLIFGGLQLAPARFVAVLLLVALVARGLLVGSRPTWPQLRPLVVPIALVVAAIVFALLQNEERSLFLLPVATNVGLLLAFARSLFVGPPLVETFARLQVPDLPPEEVRYCRAVTKVWAGFFVVNGAACVWLALFGSPFQWVFYTGFLSYLLMGALFAGEFVVRSWRFGRYAGTPVEPLFRKWFRPPPEEPVSASASHEV